jgi:hypothetical protein
MTFNKIVNPHFHRRMLQEGRCIHLISLSSLVENMDEEKQNPQKSMGWIVSKMILIQKISWML